jgi:hypothetical protein
MGFVVIALPTRRAKACDTVSHCPRGPGTPILPAEAFTHMHLLVCLQGSVSHDKLAALSFAPYFSSILLICLPQQIS